MITFHLITHQNGTLGYKDFQAVSRAQGLVKALKTLRSVTSRTFERFV